MMILDAQLGMSAISFIILLVLFACTSIAEILFSIQGRQIIRRQENIGLPLRFVVDNWQRVNFSIQLIRQFSTVGVAVTGAYWWVIYSRTLPTQISTLDAMLSVAIIFCLIVIVADLVPKVITTKYTQKMIENSAHPVYLMTLLTTPIYWLVNTILTQVCALIGVSFLEAKKMLTEEEIKKLVDDAQEEGILESSEKEMIRSIFHFSETVVREIMTPRTDAVCIDGKKTVRDAISLIGESGHSRIPVFEGSSDTVVGFAYAKDLLSVSPSDRDLPIKKYLRPAVFIPETQSIGMLLHELKEGRTHLAIVVDEFGSAAGLVTLEDVIEEIVGEIRDEYDPIVRSELVELAPGKYSVSGGMNVTDFSEAVDVEIPESDDYDTVGGFLLHHCGDVPEIGEVIEFDHFSFKVEERSSQRITRLELIKTANDHV